MIPYKHIEYNGERYPVFIINIIDQNSEEAAQNMKTIRVAVSVESLARELMDLSGTPVNSEATVLDKDIFFYIPDELAGRDACEIADFVSDNCW